MAKWPNLRQKLALLVEVAGCGSAAGCAEFETASSCASLGRPGPGTHVLPCGHPICAGCLASKRPGGAFRCPSCNGLVRGGAKSAVTSAALTEALGLAWRTTEQLTAGGDSDSGGEDSGPDYFGGAVGRLRELLGDLRLLAGTAPPGAGRKRGASPAAAAAAAAAPATALEVKQEKTAQASANPEAVADLATPPSKISKQKKRQSGRLSSTSAVPCSPTSTPEPTQQQQKKPTQKPKQKQNQTAGAKLKPEVETAPVEEIAEKSEATPTAMPRPAPPHKPLREAANSSSGALAAPAVGRRLAKEARISQSPGLNYSQRSAANIDKRNRKGETLLQVACIRGELDKAAQLLSEGADPNTKDNAGWTPLHECVTRGHIELARLLLDSGASANIPGGDNDTPLHDAVETDRPEMARLLVEFGANPDQQNLAGRTPRQLCRSDAMRLVLEQTRQVHEAPRQFEAALPELAAAAACVSRPPQLVSSGLSAKDRKLTDQLAAMIDGNCSKVINTDTTHLITSVDERGSAPRTLKFLEAVALGRWIVSFEWVQQCAAAKTRVSEEPFEVTGTCSLPDCDGPRRSRLNRQQGLPPLFNGCHFYLDSASIDASANPSRQELGRLIGLAGGSVLTREPKAGFKRDFAWTVPYHAAKDSTLATCAVICLFDTKKQQQQQKQQKRQQVDGVVHRSVDWLMNCLTQSRLVD